MELTPLTGKSIFGDKGLHFKLLYANYRFNCVVIYMFFIKLKSKKYLQIRNAQLHIVIKCITIR